MKQAKLERFAALATELEAASAKDGRSALENTRLGYDGLAQLDMARASTRRTIAAQIRRILS